MDKVEVTRNGESNQFSVVLSQGSDTIRCMVSIAEAIVSSTDARRAALSKAKALAEALSAAIGEA